MDPRRIDAAAEAAAWYRALRETSNEAFMPLYFDKHRYLVLKGGGGSGKSIFAGRKVLERVTSEPGHRWLVVRKVARTLRESCFAQLIGQLSDHYAGTGYKINKSDMKITFRNGSEIIFAGLDDVEKLKSIYDITGIWIEEASEILESDFNQLDIRLRTAFPHYLQIILSFNPVSITHWLKKRFFDKPDPLARVHESTYKDNRFATADQVRTLEGFRETDEYFYEVYTLGTDIVDAIRKLPLSNEKKAVLYQLADSGWKPKNNPFATGVGQEVYDLVQEEKTRRENSGEEEKDEEKGKAKWVGGRLVLPKWSGQKHLLFSRARIGQPTP